MKTVLKFLVLLFVPIFGLNSCSKDRVVDDWQMNEPVIEAPSQPALALNSASRRILDGASTLSFAGSTFETLLVTSRCQSGGQPFQSETVTAYRPTLSIKSLWPKSLWLTKSEPDLVKSECDFAFKASNTNGSTHSFELNHVKLASFASEKFNSKLSSLSIPSSAFPSEMAIAEAVISLADDFSEGGEILLACGSKTASMPVVAAARSTNVVHSLMTGLALRGQQLCHFIAYDKHAEKTPSEFSVSNDIKLKFSSTPLTVAVSYPVTAYEPGLVSGPAPQPLMVVTISNSGETSTFIKVPSVSSASVRILSRPTNGSSWPGAQTGALYESSQSETATVTMSAQGAAGTPTNGATTFELGAHQTLILTLSFQTDVLKNCLTILNASQAQVIQASYIGFRLGFDEEFFIEQKDSLDDVDGIKLSSLPAARQIGMSAPLIFARFQAELGSQLPAQVSTQPASVANTCLH